MIILLWFSVVVRIDRLRKPVLLSTCKCSDMNQLDY